MIRRSALPADIDRRLGSLGEVLADCPGIAFAYLCGGLARGERRPLSDVDIAVYVEEGSQAEEVKLQALLRAGRHLGTDELDVIVLNRAPIALAGRLLRDRQVLCDQVPFLRHRFESRAAREYGDFRRFEHRLLERRSARG